MVLSATCWPTVTVRGIPASVKFCTGAVTVGGSGSPATPETGTVWVVVLPLSVNTSEALLVPALVGLKPTFTVQVWPGSRTMPTPTQSPLVTPNWSALTPLTATSVTVRLAVPLLMTVTGCPAALPFTAVRAKVTLPGSIAATASVPLPLSGTSCVAPTTLPALSVYRRNADRRPTPAGLNVTSVVQLAPAAMSDGQLLAPFTKSPALGPVTLTEASLRSASPVLVSVTVWAPLVVPRRWPTNWSPLVSTLTLGAVVGTRPVPVTGMVSGSGVALSFTVSVPLRTPCALGVKVTSTVHDASLARATVQVVPVCVK